MSWIYDLLGNMMQIFEDSKGQVPKLFVIENFVFCFTPLRWWFQQIVILLNSLHIIVFVILGEKWLYCRYVWVKMDMQECVMNILQQRAPQWLPFVTTLLKTCKSRINVPFSDSLGIHWNQPWCDWTVIVLSLTIVYNINEY